MAIDLGTGNTSRYYSVPDHADFSLPNGDWSWITLANFPSGQSTANAFYLISTGTVQAANSFNLFISSGTQKPAVVVNTGGVLETHTTSTPTDKWMIFYSARRSNNLYVGHCALDATSVTESVPQTLTSGSDGSLLYLGSRNDLHTGRFWQGRIGYAAFAPGYGVTTDDILALSKGAPLLSSPAAPNLKFLFHGRSANATITDLINGHAATRKGSSYGTNEEDAQTPYIWFPEHIAGVSSSPPSEITGTVDRTNANDTSAASGTTTVTGSSATANADDTASASGSASDASGGSVAYTNVSDTSTASGTVTVNGSLASANSSDTVTASGFAGSVTGTVNYTNNGDTSTARGASGTVTEEVFSGGYPVIDHKERKRKKRLELGIISEDKPKAKILIPSNSGELKKAETRKQKADLLAQQEALNAELKRMMQIELEQEEEAIVRLLMEL